MLLKLKRQQNNYKKNTTTNNRNYYEWIDKKILANSFEDYRKIIVNLILAPYLIVIKKLSFEDAFKIINEWLQKCDLLRRLDFNVRSVVNTALVTAQKKQIPPMTLYTLKNNYKNLYFLIEHKKGKEGGEG
jgi:ABC-type siderophore export system fused ATPase/permease subunit